MIGGHFCARGSLVLLCSRLASEALVGPGDS